MRFNRNKRSEAAMWVLVGGAVLTAAAAAFAVSRILRSEKVSSRRERRGLEKRIVQALLVDPNTCSQAIDVATVGSGIVELSGMVETEQDARHVLARVDAVPGVHSVVNRLEIRALEKKLARNRQRQTDGARWYGGSVGIGRRRQSFMTDPPRRDDHVDLLARALQPNRDDTLTDVEEMEATGVRIGVSKAGGSFTTDVAPPSPDQTTDAPGAPQPVVPHDKAQPQ